MAKRIQGALNTLDKVKGFIDQLHEATSLEAAKQGLKSKKNHDFRVRQLEAGSFYAQQLVRAASERNLLLTPTPLMWLSSMLQVNLQLKEVVDTWAKVAKYSDGRGPQRDLHEVVLVGLIGVIIVAAGGRIGKMSVNAQPTPFQQTCFELLSRRKRRLNSSTRYLYLIDLEAVDADADRDLYRRIVRLFKDEPSLRDHIHRISELARKQPQDLDHVAQNHSVWCHLLTGPMPNSSSATFN